MTDVERRHELVESVERHEQELEVALADLKQAVRRPFALANDVRDKITAQPLPWILSSVLLGLWLGTRGGSSNGRNGHDV